MKLPPILTGIVLDPVAGTLDFTALGANFDPRTVLGVLHEPTNRFIFAKGRAGLGYKSIAGTVMTLALDTTGLLAGPLIGFRDDGALIATDAQLVACRNLLATISATQSNIATAVGTPSDVDPGSDATAASVVALLKRGLGRWTTFLSQFGSSVGLPADAAATSDSATASLIALTKRELAASTTGNASLASIATTSNGTSGSTAALNTATGAKTDAATASGADTSVIGALRAIRDRLLGTLNTTLATGSNVIGAVTQSGTWAANATLQAGSAIVGRVGIDQTTPGTTNGVVVNSSALPAGAALDATLTARLGTLGQKAMAGSAPVVIASDQAPLPTTIRSAGTNRSASVGTAAVTLMPANAGRQGWKIKNDSAGDLWINFDATATAAAGSGNIKIPSGSYLSSEPGFVETGAMSVIGSAAALAITAREY